MEASPRRVRAQRGRRRLPRRLRSPARRWARRLAGVLATAALVAVAVASARLVVSVIEGQRPEAAEADAPAPRDARAGRVTTLRRAVAVLARRGYVPVRRSDYRRGGRLRVLVGRPRGAPKGLRRAFFFAHGRVAGRDARGGSARLRLVAAGRRTVVLEYRTRPGGVRVRVRFRWTGHRVKALDPVPSPTARRAR